MCHLKPSSLTVLEALEQQGVTAPFQCREGYCGTCTATLVSGEIEYVQEPIAYNDDRRVVLCCCKATTDIEISFVGSKA
ncbi:class I ribonucleotide reductase maintenance protein YfaE [Vibrio mediterranei]|uniref:class I ribonucleotide reductase maintenance protein YfaE n=1 Tax=Vibrio mediterranei TaxID=689 RepID=UPI004067DCCC